MTSAAEALFNARLILSELKLRPPKDALAGQEYSASSWYILRDHLAKDQGVAPFYPERSRRAGAIRGR